MCRCRSFLIGKRNRATAKSPGRASSANTSKFCNRIGHKAAAPTLRRRGSCGPGATKVHCGNTAAYSTMSSAVASIVCGTVRPSVFAVVRFTNNSYLVGPCTANSAGFAPRRIRST